jgi:Flp pilus assembly protein TadG
MQSLVRRRDESGQALVEFALITPLLFILLFGIIQFGATFGGQVGLSNAAREVTRYASTLPASGANETLAEAYAPTVLQRSIPAYAGGANVNVSYCYYPDPTTPITYSRKVTVTITYGHTLFVPLVGVFVDGFDGSADNRWTTTVREEMRVESQPLKNAPAGTACGANP